MKNSMFKVRFILIIFVSLLSLNGCSATVITPEATYEKYLQEFKATSSWMNDVLPVTYTSYYFTGYNGSILNKKDTIEDEIYLWHMPWIGKGSIINKDVQLKILSVFKKILFEFDYKINSTQLSDNDTKAIINVTFTNIDSVELVSSTKNRIGQSVHEETQGEVERVIADIIANLYKNAPKTTIKTVDINMIKKSNKWYIDNVDDSAMFIALSGGLVGY